MRRAAKSAVVLPNNATPALRWGRAAEENPANHSLAQSEFLVQPRQYPEKRVNARSSGPDLLCSFDEARPALRVLPQQSVS